MKLIIELDPEISPNLVGECLRNSFFNGEIGCCTNFDWHPDVKELAKIEVIGNPGHVWNRGQMPKKGIECRWFWDSGDGTLEFWLPDGAVLSNYDCKKQYGWKYYPPSENMWKCW